MKLWPCINLEDRGKDPHLHAFPLWLPEVKALSEEQCQDGKSPHEKQTLLVHLYTSRLLTDLASEGKGWFMPRKSGFVFAFWFTGSERIPGIILSSGRLHCSLALFLQNLSFAAVMLLACWKKLVFGEEKSRIHRLRLWNTSLISPIGITLRAQS